MVNTYGASALNDPVRSAQALALVIDERGGSSALYTQLAILYYTAGNVRKSVLAERDAVRLADPDQRKLVRRASPPQRKQIDKAKLQARSSRAAAPGPRPAAERPAAPSGYHHRPRRPQTGRAASPL